MDIMIDLETLGLTHNAKLLSIGACCFDITILSTREELAKDAFYVNVDTRSYAQVDGLFSETASTLKFWKEQPQEAKQVLEADKLSFHEAVQYFLSWRPRRPMSVWANSPSFDLEILKYHARVIGSTSLLWDFREERDFRTLKAMHTAKFGAVAQNTQGIKHYALDDTVNQAYDAQRFYARVVQGLSVKTEGLPLREFSDSSIADARW